MEPPRFHANRGPLRKAFKASALVLAKALAHVSRHRVGALPRGRCHTANSCRPGLIVGVFFASFVTAAALPSGSTATMTSRNAELGCLGPPHCITHFYVCPRLLRFCATVLGSTTDHTMTVPHTETPLPSLSFNNSCAVNRTKYLFRHTDGVKNSCEVYTGQCTCSDEKQSGRTKTRCNRDQIHAFCKERGYSYVWTSSQRPQLTKQGKSTACKTENCVPFVIPGLTSRSSTASSSTSPSSDSTSSSSQGEVTSKLQKTAATLKKALNTYIKKDDNRDADERVRDFSEWLQEFPHNPQDTEMPAPAHISRDSDSELRKKVVPNSSTHSIFYSLPERPKLRSMLENQNDKAPSIRRNSEAAPRAEKFGDLITVDHNVLTEEGASRNNHLHAVVVQDLATQWIQSCPCKTKTPQETKKV